MNAYIKILIRKDFTKKDGTKPIYLRLTLDRKIKYFSLNISVKSEYWDHKSETIKKTYPDSYNLNLLIESSKTRAKQIIFEHKVKNLPLSLWDFEQLFNKTRATGKSFFEFTDKELELMKVTFSPASIKTYKSHLAKLKEFHSNLSFTDLNINFLKSYDNHLSIKGNCQNTRFKSMAIIKSFINRAMVVNQELIKENPFDNYPIGQITGNREFLNTDELKQLEKLLDKDFPKYLNNVLRYFLFSCYTGLRFQDIKNLKYSDLENGMIKIVLHKNRKRNEWVTIPLSERAKNLLPGGLKYQKIFHVNTNQVTNRYLKDIMKVAGIKKDISFHCARHTFATLSITLEMPIEVVSKLLGHKSLKTTQIYAKILDDVKVKQMKKWDTW
jgi:integrase